MNKSHIQQQMKQEGHRTSKTRDAVISLFNTYSKPLSAPEIEQLLHENKIVVNKTTIYRELEKLLNHTIIKEVYLRDDKVRYELATRSHHHHLVCISCKKVDDVPASKNIHIAEDQIAKSFDYRILDHSLEFFGVCKSCQ